MPLPGNVVTRFPGGFTNNALDNPFADLATSDPTKFHTFFDDFDNYLAAEWVVTEVGAGGTQALADGDGGLLVLTADALDNDAVFLQWAGNSGGVIESFLPASGKKLFFKMRLKLSDATQTDAVFGLQIADTTPLSVTDGIYFIKNDDAATLDFVVRKDATTGSTSATAIATLANDTFFTASFYYDGESKVYYAVNDVVLGSLDGSSSFLPDAALAPSFGVQNGSAGGKVMTVDYFFAAKER